jgi:hypothetical protein
MVTGGVVGAAGMLYLTQLGVTTTYAVHLLPALLVLGLGLGLMFVPLSSLALVGVPEHDAGAASAALNATQQVGGSLGTALLNTIYTTAVASYLTSHLPPSAQTQVKGLVHGYVTAFAWGAALVFLAAIVVVALVQVRKEDLATTPNPV